MKKNVMKKTILAAMMTMTLGVVGLTGCGQKTTADKGAELAAGGVLVLSVNPEIAVTYDEKGIVTEVTARNDDANEIIENCGDMVGKTTGTVATELVNAIGKAGYFVEETEGERRQITLEIEAGSKLPHDTFLEEVVSEIRECVNSNQWEVPMNVENESDYGMTDYVDTDYGPENDGVTDYADTADDGVTDYADTADDGITDYADAVDDGVTDYADAVDDGVTDYADAVDDGITDYADAADDGVTDYADATDDGVTDYDDAADDGATDYADAADDGATDYDDDSDDGNSDYDD